MALLEVKNLKTSFFTPNGEVKAIDDISFSLDKGKVLGIVGESGSGKSVTAYSILQILTHPGKIVGGSILYSGADIITWSKDSFSELVVGCVYNGTDLSKCSNREISNFIGKDVYLKADNTVTSSKAALARVIGESIVYDETNNEIVVKCSEENLTKLKESHAASNSTGTFNSGADVSIWTSEETNSIINKCIVHNGTDIVKCSKEELRTIRGNKISIIFQDPMTSLNPVYTVGNQLTEAILLHTKRTREEAKVRAIELLELVGINEPDKRVKQYPFQLSGGMRQRVMIAMALACEPDVLIADEPTTALDVTIQAQILELMQSLQTKLSMSIIMITHDLGVIAGMCDEVIVMYAGQICEQGTTDEIFYKPCHEYTKGLLRSIPSLHSDKKERLIPIGGTPIDMLNLPDGCAFSTRCEKCMKICLAEKPQKRIINADHMSSCWINDLQGVGEIIQREDNSNE